MATLASNRSKDGYGELGIASFGGGFVGTWCRSGVRGRHLSLMLILFTMVVPNASNRFFKWKGNRFPYWNL